MANLEVAIVGSGPSGFYAAHGLLNSGVDAVVHMFDRLPTPYGLVRSGVAPDHQHIKQVVRVFEGVARNPLFSFIGNVEVGRDISLDALRSRYDAVILAYGASGGLPLEVPGADMQQSLTAAQFVGWYNGHPDYVNLPVCFDHETAVIVGHGNVAIDMARVLLSDHDRLSKTDIADHALEALRESRIRTVHLVGRRGPLQASFTTAELRELLLGIDGISTKVNAEALVLDPEEIAWVEQPANSVIQRNVRVLTEAASRMSASVGEKEVHLDFLMSPAAIRGEDRAQSIEFVRNTLVGSVASRKAVATGERCSIPAGLVISSIGFRGRQLANIPFDDNRGVVPNVSGRVTAAAIEGMAPLYVTGWIKRGPTGVIGTNRADAVETIQCLLEDFRDGRLSARPPKRGSNLTFPATRVDFEGWSRIDEAERVAGSQSGRPRQKFVDIDLMLKVASAESRPEAASEEIAAGH